MMMTDGRDRGKLLIVSKDAERNIWVRTALGALGCENALVVWGEERAGFFLFIYLFRFLNQFILGLVQ